MPTATSTTIASSISYRDRAVLRAVAAGRCQLPHEFCGSLVVDGRCFTDQFAGLRLRAAGLIAETASATVRLTASGQELLDAA
jgi:hypothetical protein